MKDMDKLYNESSTATNIQFHEIKPNTDNSMSFGALLEKFYMNSDAGKGNDNEMQSKLDEISKAQELVTAKSKSA